MSGCKSIRNRLVPVMLLLPALACGGDGPTDPPDAVYGETTVVYVLNPVVNDVNAVTVPTPGTTRTGVGVAVTGGPSGTTGSTGDLALAAIPTGARPVSFTDGTSTGQLTLDIAAGDLREIAVALNGAGAGSMADVRYIFGGTVVEIRPTMTIAQVNAELAKSNLIVFLRAGTYTGNLNFSGSNVTLFGEGSQGGTVVLNGNVTVSGSGNRFRGARINGSLTVVGSGAGISYSRVDGTLTVEGSNAVLLNNAFCGSVAVTGSGILALGNAGLSPIPASSGGC
jgi:lipopolysaccharide export system protein LptA